MVPCEVFHSLKFDCLMACAPHFSFSVAILVLIMAWIFVLKVRCDGMLVYMLLVVFGVVQVERGGGGEGGGIVSEFVGRHF